jgi:hypothetical protein
MYGISAATASETFRTALHEPVFGAPGEAAAAIDVFRLFN